MTLLSIYVSLLAFIVTFLSGVQNYPHDDDDDYDAAPGQTDGVLESDEFVAPDGGPCTAVAALLHFFLLATFCWNGVYGTQLLLLIRSTRTSLPPRCHAASAAVGWGTAPPAGHATAAALRLCRSNACLCRRGAGRRHGDHPGRGLPA